jgi:hypothetical protein
MVMKTLQKRTTKYSVYITQEDVFDDSLKERLCACEHRYFDDSEYRCSCAFSIRVFSNAQEIASAAVGGNMGASGLHETALILEEERLLFCCANQVFCLSLPALHLQWKTEADTATCFQIFPYKADYIIHGEFEITRLNRAGNILWQHSGRDIFVSPDGQPECVLQATHILAMDWDGNRYAFDYETGNNCKVR